MTERRFLQKFGNVVRWNSPFGVHLAFRRTDAGDSHPESSLKHLVHGYRRIACGSWIRRPSTTSSRNPAVFMGRPGALRNGQHCHAPGIFHLSFYLLSTSSRLTQDIPQEKTRQPLSLEVHKVVQRLHKRTIELLGIVPIPIQHVVVVRTHGPIVHRHPLHHTIRSKD